ncbi:MAG: glycerophosphodiester phosphodiesterase [Actinobacteria bacterium]|nr:glycerophosphodiester phosphodiesterase [Actinomycetota bacterium]
MVRVIAHRGASAAATENTVEAFRLAGTLGADWIELDVRRTADGALVVHHDEALPDGRDLVALDRAEVPSHVPDLATALDACAPLSVNVEIKNWPADVDFDPAAAIVEPVVAELVARTMSDRVLVSCFHLPTLDRVRSVDPSIPTAVLHGPVEGTWDGFADSMAAAGHRALHPWDLIVDEALVEAAHRHGLEVNVWTVNDPDRMRTLVDMGVDGLCTDVPDVARAVLDDT